MFIGMGIGCAPHKTIIVASTLNQCDPMNTFSLEYSTVSRRSNGLSIRRSNR
jgi:hypothetical protein